jgi:hypothetical protein
VHEQLGRVCKLKPHQNHGKGNHGSIVDGALFVTGGNATGLLETVEKALDLVALTIDGFIESATPWLVGFVGQGAADASPPQEATESARTIGFVGNDALGTFARTPAAATFDGTLLHQRLGLSGIVCLPRCQQAQDGLPLAIYAHMQLGRYSTTAASERFAGGVAFFAPAAC